MYVFVKWIFVSKLTIFGFNLLSVNPLECVSINNQECKVRPEIVNVNSNESAFYPFSVKTSKYSGSCNNINDPYAKQCFSDVAKNINIKVFSLMSRSNETRHLKWYKTSKCKCRLDASVCNSKKRWNKDKCRFEWKKLIDKEICSKKFIWNPSNYECQCHKSCDVGENLDYATGKCRKKLVDKLVKECTENIDEEKIAGMVLFECGKECKNSCTINAVLIGIVFIISIGIGAYLLQCKNSCTINAVLIGITFK